MGGPFGLVLAAVRVRNSDEKPKRPSGAPETEPRSIENIATRVRRNGNNHKVRKPARSSKKTQMGSDGADEEEERPTSPKPTT